MVFRKKIKIVALAVLFSFVSLIFFPGCSRQKENDDGSVKILATFYPLYIMLMNITDGIPGVSISMLAPADTGCLHDYQLTTRDMKSIENCDILVANGAGMEDFLDKALKVKSDRTIIASDGFDLVEDNPHVWVSIDGAVYQVLEIAAGLARLDPERSDLYMDNASEYVDKLISTSIMMHSRLDGYRGRRIVTFHEAFPYFAEEFGLELAAIVEREPGTEPNARDLYDLVLMVRGLESGGKKVVLFAEPQYSSSATEIIAQETGHPVWILDPGVTGELDKDEYISIMKKNMETLEAALK